jgi:LysR family transcriptional regulator, hydrogen peroxide-inducible genes activator
MELYQIRYFLAVAETLNFTRAAERCFVSQSALTKAIQRLEEIVGGRLLDRSSKSVQLTALGLAMHPNFKQINDSTVEARQFARKLAKDAREKVRVGVMCTIDFQLMFHGFSACEDLYANLALSFEEGNLEMLTDGLEAGDIDLGIMCSPYTMAKRFTSVPLFEERFVLAFGNDHRFNGRPSISLSELNREKYCDRTNCEYSNYIEGLLTDAGVRVEVVQESGREDWVAAFVRANFGVSFMPESMAKAASLGYAHIEDCPVIRTVQVLHKAGWPLTKAHQTLLASLASHQWPNSAINEV